MFMLPSCLKLRMQPHKILTTSKNFDIHNIFKKYCLLFGASKTRYEELQYMQGLV